MRGKSYDRVELTKTIWCVQSCTSLRDLEFNEYCLGTVGILGFCDFVIFLVVMIL